VDGEDYDLEYGSSRIEIHRDAVAPGDRVLVVDDLLATGGTAAAAGRLLERMGARMEGYAFMVELSSLEGRNRLGGGGVFSLLRYDGPGSRKAGP
jgi:adenine phosphoribosyltransferase